MLPLLSNIRICLAMTLLGLSFLTVAATAPVEEKPVLDKAATVNQTMSKIGQLFVNTFPLIVSSRELTEKEYADLVAALGQFSELFSSVETHMKQRSDAYQIGFGFVTEYLKVTRQMFNDNEQDYGKIHLYALGEICSTCHTQDTHLRTLFSGSSRDRFDSDYAFAEFNFVTRNYSQALQYYEAFLLGPEIESELELIQPLQRMLTIYVQVNNEPAVALEKLKRFTKLPKHTPETLAELNGWMQGLQALLKDEADKVAAPDFPTLERFVKRYFGRSVDIPMDIESNAVEEVERVWLRGRLNHYLNAKPDPDTIPKVLYWLSVCDRSTAYNFYFSLADLFLKQCVLNYSKHPFARRCFREYKAYIDYHYGREDMAGYPPEIEQELRQLEAVLTSTK